MEVLTFQARRCNEVVDELGSAHRTGLRAYSIDLRLVPKQPRVAVVDLPVCQLYRRGLADLIVTVPFVRMAWYSTCAT